MLYQILHIFCQRQLPMRVFCLAAIGINHDIFIANLFDEFQVVCQIALILSAAHVLCIAAL